MRLPPLNALRAFDAVLRLGGVRAAAEALSVTPGAVTQQLRVLERHFGRPLLERHGRGVAATEAGRALHANTSRHLRAIAAASEGLRAVRSRIRVTAAHGVATRWLVPRLRDFNALHPEARVMLEASSEVVDLHEGTWDVALREGDGRYVGLRSELLFPLDLVPVAAAGYADAAMWGLRSPRLRARLLHDGGPHHWQRWLDSLQAPGIAVDEGVTFSNSALAITAAIDGQGVALASPIVVRAELEAGTLVRLDSRALVTGTAVHAVWADDRDDVDHARAFRQWLLEQAVRDRTGDTTAGSNPKRAAKHDDPRT